MSFRLYLLRGCFLVPNDGIFVFTVFFSAILTVFQIPQAADDPITRTFALLSLICALMSLSYGCIYIVRFGTMRSMFHASRWAEVGHIYSTGTTNTDSIFLGCKGDEDRYLVERLGFTCHACYLDGMVR